MVGKKLSWIGGGLIHILILGKEHFAPILQNAISTLNPETIVKGFEACGLYPWNPNRIDFTKCLGRSKTIKADDSGEKNGCECTMTFKDFSNIVGDKIGEMKSDTASHECEYTNILKQIYNFFNHLPSSPRQGVENVNNSIIEIPDFILSEEDIENIPVIFDIGLNSDEPIAAGSLPYNEKIIIHQNIELSGGMLDITFNHLNSEDNSKDIDMKEEGTERSKNSEDNTIDRDMKEEVEGSERSKQHRPLLEKPRLENEIVDQEGILKEAMVLEHTDLDVELEIFDRNLTQSQTEKSIENIDLSNKKECTIANIQNLETNKDEDNNINLEDFLPKARTPQRKNKIQVQRSSFVITSSAYKNQMEENKRVKEELEKRKEENRKKREQNKLDKQKKQECGSDKSEENITAEKNFIKKTGMCFTCTANITSKKIGIKCQDCMRVYHVVCLKKKGLFKDFYRCSICTMKRRSEISAPEKK